MLRLLVVLTMLHDELKFPVVVRGLITLGCILFVTFPQLPDEFIIVAIVLPLLDFGVSDPSESITKMKVIIIEKLTLLSIVSHSTPNGLSMKWKILLTRPSRGERACIRGSEYTLFRILE